VRSRNYLEFVLLAPGVTRASLQPAAGALTSVLPSSGFSVGGLRPRSNTLTIDGIDNTDEFTGSSRTALSLEVVREFQVVTSGWVAERGGGSAGTINGGDKRGAKNPPRGAVGFGPFRGFKSHPKTHKTLFVGPLV